jgi:phosphoglycerate dehydrogenase-like enzyme
MAETVNVLVTLALDEILVERLMAVSPRINLMLEPANRVEEISKESWEKAQVLYTNRVIPTPEQAPLLKWIQFHWAGINHARGAPILERPDLSVTTLSGAACSQVAEYILMMLLSLGHRLLEMRAAQRRSEWPQDRWHQFSPKELRNSTVGIIGYGSIGRQTARLLQPFGAKILVAKYNAMKTKDEGYSIPDMGDLHGELPLRIYPPQALKTMVRDCDFVVVTAPLTDETKGLVDAEVLQACKPGAYLVHTSRAGVVDQEALVAALKSGKLAGAALDVFMEEPLPAESPLWKLPNLIITPHIAGNSTEYDGRAIDLFAENLRRYLMGLPLLNLYDAKRGY